MVSFHNHRMLYRIEEARGVATGTSQFHRLPPDDSYMYDSWGGLALITRLLLVVEAAQLANGKISSGDSRSADLISATSRQTLRSVATR